MTFLVSAVMVMMLSAAGTEYLANLEGKGPVETKVEVVTSAKQLHPVGETPHGYNVTTERGF